MTNFIDQGFILHQWKTKESSALFSVFTKNNGKIMASAPKIFSKNGKIKSDFAFFTPLNFSFSKEFNNSFLKINTVNIEQLSGVNVTLEKQIAGLYLNELLFKLLEQETPYTKVYKNYSLFFSEIFQCSLKEKLRIFEWDLIKDLGYQILFPSQITTKNVYSFDPEYGQIFDTQFSKKHHELEGQLFFPGTIVEEMKNNDFSKKQTNDIARILFLRQLQWHTSIEKLDSLKLFSEWRKNKNE